MTVREIVHDVRRGIAVVAEGLATGPTDSEEIRDAGRARMLDPERRTPARRRDAWDASFEDDSRTRWGYHDGPSDG